MQSYLHHVAVPAFAPSSLGSTAAAAAPVSTNPYVVRLHAALADAVANLMGGESRAEQSIPELAVAIGRLAGVVRQERQQWSEAQTSHSHQLYVLCRGSLWSAEGCDEMNIVGWMVRWI